MSFYFTEKPFERFGKTLIEEVNLSVEPGEHIAIVGDNGVGNQHYSMQFTINIMIQRI